MDGHDCPEGQSWDAEKGQCVAKETKEQLTDAGQSTQGDMAEGDPGEVQQVDPTSCPEGHKFDADLSMCVPSDQKDPGDGQTQGTDKTASIENLAKVVKSQSEQLLDILLLLPR